MNQIIRADDPPLPAHYSIWVHQLVDCMLNKNPNERPKISDILEFPPVAKYVAAIKADERFVNIYTEAENQMDEAPLSPRKIDTFAQKEDLQMELQQQ